MLFQKGLVSVLGNAGVSVAAAAALHSANGRRWGLAPARLGALHVQESPCEQACEGHAGKRVRYMLFNGFNPLHRLYTMPITHDLDLCHQLWDRNRRDLVSCFAAR